MINKDEYSKGLEDGVKAGREAAWEDFRKNGAYKEGYAQAMEFWQNEIGRINEKGVKKGKARGFSRVVGQLDYFIADVKQFLENSSGLPPLNNTIYTQDVLPVLTKLNDLIVLAREVGRKDNYDGSQRKDEGR